MMIYSAVSCFFWECKIWLLHWYFEIESVPDSFLWGLVAAFDIHIYLEGNRKLKWFFFFIWGLLFSCTHSVSFKGCFFHGHNCHPWGLLFHGLNCHPFSLTDFVNILSLSFTVQDYNWSKKIVIWKEKMYYLHKIKLYNNKDSIDNLRQEESSFSFFCFTQNAVLLWYKKLKTIQNTVC